MSHIGIVAMSNPKLGGTFQYTLSMIDALRRIPKNTYTIFTVKNNNSYDDLGIPVLRLPSVGLSIGEYLRTRLFTGSNTGLFREVDKVIAPIYSTRLLATRRPFLFTLHDLQERYYPENFTIAQRLWRTFANKSLSRAANGIICESSFVKNDIHNFLGVDASKIIVLPAPPVSDFLPENANSATIEQSTQQLNLPKQYLLYPAQFFPHKNHIRLVEAFSLVLRKYPACHLLLTGQNKYNFQNVMRRVMELGIQDRVSHLGYIDTNTLACVYSRASMVVIPTLFESISIPVYEAFRMGVPVCASNVVALPEQIGDAGILFDPLSVADMADKISLVLGNAELRLELVKRGRKRIDHFSTDSYAEQLEVILDRLG